MQWTKFDAAMLPPPAQQMHVTLDRKPAGPQEIPIIDQQFFEARTCDVRQLDLGSLEVPDAMLPSAMFCLPDLAACTI